MSQSTHYWLISIPTDKTREETWDRFDSATSQYSENYLYSIPPLKVGTLDQLIGLSDELSKLETVVDSLAHKIAMYLHEVLEDQHDIKLQENLQANRDDLPTYITRFQWDLAKYPIRNSLKTIADIISKQTGQIDIDYKTRSTTYNGVRSNLQNLEKKLTGSLLTRNLADIVKKEHFILNSTYLTTLVVVVPKTSFNDWNAGYEKLTDMVVPRSTQLIFQDAEFGLFTVTLFKIKVDDFKHRAREKKFVVRDFTYNEEALTAGKNDMTHLALEKKRYFGPLVRWLKVNFGECFSALIHVKVMRVFVECVLRYGLPVDFVTILMCPYKGKSKRIHKILNTLYGHLDSNVGQQGQDVDMGNYGINQSSYYPYVYFEIDIAKFETGARITAAATTT